MPTINHKPFVDCANALDDEKGIESKLREALYALNRALEALNEALPDNATTVQVKHCRDVVWTAGVATFGWTD